MLQRFSFICKEADVLLRECASIGNSLTMTMYARPTLTLLSRAYCHLCDEMREALEPLAKRFGAAIVVCDVDADESLERRYGERVPVLMLGSPPSGVELCHYTLDVEAVLRALDER